MSLKKRKYNCFFNVFLNKFLFDIFMSRHNVYFNLVYKHWKTNVETLFQKWLLNFRLPYNIHIYISTWDHKWSTIHRVLKSHRSKMGTIYMQSWKQCALSVIPVSTLCVADHLWPLILRSLLSSLSIIWFVGTSNV